MLKPSVVKRLLFIKNMHRMAIEHSRLPEPMNAVSVLTFHDSVELFLHLSAEHLGLSPSKNITFLDLWNDVVQKLPRGDEILTQKVAMVRLDDARVE